MWYYVLHLVWIVMLHQRNRAQQPRRIYKLLQGGVGGDSNRNTPAFALFLCLPATGAS